MRQYRFLALLGGLGGLFSFSSANLPTYALIEIKPITGGTDSVVYGVSTANEVVGYSDPVGPLYYILKSKPIPLPSAKFTSVDIDGVCAGYNSNNAAVWDPNSGLTTIPLPTGAFGSVATGINDRGWACGFYQDRASLDSPILMHTFRWDPVVGTAEDVADNAQGWAINMDGAIACNAYFNHPTLPVGRFFLVNGDDTIVVPPIPPIFQFEQPSGISTIGPRVCGTVYMSDPTGAPDSVNRAFLFDENSNWWTLPDPADASLETFADGTNFWGDYVVGYSIPSVSHRKAIVWEVDPTNPFNPYTATDLNTVLSPTTAAVWQLAEATGVNSYHSICGWGFHYVNGQWIQEGFLLIPQNLAEVYTDPRAILGGNTAFGSVLTDVASSVDTTLSLSSSNPAIVVPSSVTIPGGTKAGTFLIDTSPVATNQTGTITASLGKSTTSTTFTVLAATPNGLTLSADAVVGGTSLTGTFAYNGAVPKKVMVNLSSNNAAVQVPNIVTIAANSSQVAFPVTTTAPAVTVTATITAKIGASTFTDDVTVTP